MRTESLKRIHSVVYLMYHTYYAGLSAATAGTLSFNCGIGFEPDVNL